MDKIMVAVDFTDASDAAVAEALSLAERLQAELHIVHVAAPPPPSPAELIAREPSEMDTDDAKAQLAKMVAGAKARGVAARSHLLVGQIVFGLVDVAGRIEAKLVVVGSHGKGLVRRALVGSVAASLCRHSPVPVLVVPSLRRHATVKTAWSCEQCGHILGRAESSERCGGCGAHPVRWLSAPIEKDRVDIAEPAVGEVDAETVGLERTNTSAGLFAVSPPGTEGYDVNPELRVRY